RPFDRKEFARCAPGGCDQHAVVLAQPCLDASAPLEPQRCALRPRLRLCQRPRLSLCRGAGRWLGDEVADADTVLTLQGGQWCGGEMVEGFATGAFLVLQLAVEPDPVGVEVLRQVAEEVRGRGPARRARRLADAARGRRADLAGCRGGLERPVA